MHVITSNIKVLMLRLLRQYFSLFQLVLKANSQRKCFAVHTFFSLADWIEFHFIKFIKPH